MTAAGVFIPAQLAHVSINFTRDSLKDVLLAAGFYPNRTSLFLVWEAVMHYLPGRRYLGVHEVEFTRWQQPVSWLPGRGSGHAGPVRSEGVAGGDASPYDEWIAIRGAVTPRTQVCSYVINGRAGTRKSALWFVADRGILLNLLVNL